MKKNAPDQKTQSVEQSQYNNNTKSMVYNNSHLSQLQGAIVDQLKLVDNKKCSLKFLFKRMKDTGYKRQETIQALDKLTASDDVIFTREKVSRSHCVPFSPDAITVYVELVGGDV